MLKRYLAVTLAAGLLAGASFAAPAKKAVKPAAKQVEVLTCPVTGEKVAKKTFGSRVVGKYKVYFCCPGCDKQFDSWSAAKKQKVVAQLAAKEAAAKKGKPAGKA